ncbi:MAG: lipopolysaccharide assembly protein [Gammaproteobacteria bacterium]|jgi:lipopolysaccharide biosynthesis regulator YciM|nr:lipopolysaccharide assembly protein [Gammaproteobacteria bacterium]
MPELSPLTWAVGIAALVIGILAGHFGWGKRWRLGYGDRYSKLHPDYLAGLDYLVTEQPDRALDMFLKLMDTNADTLETHFALGSLYRRRGEVERAIRIHQNLLAREALAPEHREQALLALAHDHLRAGLLDRAEELFQKVSEVPRLRATALDSLRGVYERQHEWQQALGTYRQLARIKAAPPRLVASHYLCELATLAIERGEADVARRLLREAQQEVSPFPRAAVLRARIAEHDGDRALAIRLLRTALREAPTLMHEELPHLLRLVGSDARDSVLTELVAVAESRNVDELKRLVFAALSADLVDAPPLRAPIEKVFAQDATLRAVWWSNTEEGQRTGEPGEPRAVGEALPGDTRGAVGDKRHLGDARAWSDDRRTDTRRIANEIGALLARAEKYRCGECGFAGRSFYWHCPACHAWDSFEAYAIVKLG